MLDKTDNLWVLKTDFKKLQSIMQFIKAELKNRIDRKDEKTELYLEY